MMWTALLLSRLQFAFTVSLHIIFPSFSIGLAALVCKCEGQIRERAYRWLPALNIGVLALLACAFVAAMTMHLELMNRWLERPYLLIFPLIGVLSAYGLLKQTKRRTDLAPFRFTALIFISAFGTLACFWPFMIPFALTVEQAASPPASLNFMFWGAGLFVMPLTVVYTAVVYRLFRGKVVEMNYE